MATYTGTTPKDLDLTTPTEGSTPPSEVNDAIREIKTVYKYQEALHTITTDTTLTAAYHTVLCNGTLTVTLPQSSTVASSAFTKQYVIINIGTGAVTIDGYSSETINGATTMALTAQYTCAVISSNGSNWFGGIYSSDYRPSTWTPAVNGASGTTYTTQNGWYTRDGNIVHLGFELTINAKGTITGNAAISGIPFTSSASPGKTAGTLIVLAASGLSTVWEGIYIGESQSVISIYAKTAAGTAAASVNGTDFFAAGTQLVGHITYKV